MSSDREFSVTLASMAETEAMARRISPGLGPGDVILLDGPIGAGKTFFARAVIQERLRRSGHMEDVPSPTFTLVQTYDAGPIEIWHADLYRLSGPGEAFELGLEEAFETAICLVEWPDRLGPNTPANAIRLRFAPGEGDEERQITVQSGHARWHALMADEVRA